MNDNNSNNTNSSNYISDNFDTRDPTATKEDLKNLDNHYQMRISQEANSLVMQNFGGLYSGDAESFMLEHIIEGRNMNEMHLNFNDEKKESGSQ